MGNNKSQAVKEEEKLSSGLDYISQILEDVNVNPDPQTTSNKNNILIIVLCLLVIGIYFLFREFLDTILLGFLSGVAYKQMRDKFVKMWLKEKKAKKQKIKILQTIILTVIMVLIPTIRHQSKNNFEDLDLSIESIWSSFIYMHNPIIRISQICILIWIISNLFGSKFKQLIGFSYISKKTKGILHFIMAISTVIVAIILIVTIVIVLAAETNSIFKISYKAFENAYDCQLYPNSQVDGNYYLQIPCSQKLSVDFQKLIPQVKNQTQIEICKKLVDNLQIDYIGYGILSEQQSENLCVFQQIIKQISPGIIESISLKETGQYLLTFISRIIRVISDSTFSIATYIGIFLITVKYFEVTSDHIFIFGAKKNELINSITTIITATVFIAIEHLAFGIILLQIFRFSEINFIVSLFLSVIAFVPLVQPSFVMLLFTILKIWSSKYYVTPVICFVVYYIYSGIVYQKYYKNVNLHKMLINLSVVFGIYQYGVSGIFYGPLIILLFQFVNEELFQPKNQR